MTMTATAMRRLVWVLAVVGLLVCVLWPLGASAQTYVRPSKGAAFDPFKGQTISSTSSRASDVFDLTAFTSIRVQVFGTGTGTNGSGVACTAVKPMDYTFKDLNNYIRISIQREGFGVIYLALEASGKKEGPFLTAFQGSSYSVNRYDAIGSIYEKFGSCSATVLATPLPFDSSRSNDDSQNHTVAASSTQGYACSPGFESRTKLNLSSSSWTAISVSGTDVSSSVCNSVLNSFSTVYCVVHDSTLQSALSTPPHTLIDSAYVIRPGECQQFGPGGFVSAGGVSIPLPKPWCASSDASVVVGVRTCSEALPYN